MHIYITLNVYTNISSENKYIHTLKIHTYCPHYHPLVLVSVCELENERDPH